MRTARLRLMMVAVALFVAASALAGEPLTPTTTGPGYVWWEGEDAVSHNFGPPSAQLMEGVKGMLSGDNWLTAQVDPTPAGGLLATWRVSVPESGRYDLWARVGYRPWTGNDWRFDDQPWRTSGKEDAFHQVVHQIRYRPTSWVLFGLVELDAGTHAFQVRFPEGQSVYQGFDCFVLSAGPFTPIGKYRPDQTIGPLIGSRGPAEGWWPFQPSYRPGEEKLVDLAFMNEPVGSHGFVTMRDGDLFFEDGTPVRFWGVNVAYWGGRMIYASHQAADRFADHLAQYGVNCVRVHILHSANSLIDPTRDDTQHFDPAKLERLDYLAAALRKRGIYVNLDLVYHRMFKEGDEIDPDLVGTGTVGDYNVNWAAGSAALFHPRAIELNRALYRKFLEHTNPYTGLRWVDDPQIALVTIQNEQSIFWGTTNIHRGRGPGRLLNGLYTDWLKRKYGTQAKLAAAWQVEGQGAPFNDGENLDTGPIDLGWVGASPPAHMRKRGLDQLRFLYDIESHFYQHTIEAMRGWGLRCPIITSNWQGAGQTTRLVIQASALGEFVDRHRYSGSGVLLEQIGRGTPGAAFEQVAGRAFGVSEWNAGVSGEYVPESVPLVATVAAFQGWDAMFQFNAGSPTWETHLRGLAVTPGHYALYPVAAMIFRRGDIAPGEVIHERRRDAQYQFSFRKEERGVPPELIAMGRIQNRYVSAPSEDVVRQDLIERLWERAAGVARAGTGQFDWHYGDRWMRLNGERTQGAFGALAGKAIVCDDVRIETPNEFCAVIVTALEEKPIREAGRLLVAAVGRSQNMALPPERGPVPEGSDRSVPPCLMEPVTGTVSVRTVAPKAYAVDAGGYRVAEVPARRGEDGFLTFRMDGRPQVLYYVLAE